MPHRTCIIATVKNEGPWLLEWVAHHLAIGFDRMIIASNDCDDGTDLMLDRLQELDLVRHVPNPPPYLGTGIQLVAYQRCRFWPEVADAEWVLPLDADEFLNIHVGDRTITALLDAIPPQTNALVLCWRIFGDSGQAGWQDQPVTRTFTSSIAERNNRAQVCHAKTLFRNHQQFRNFHAHAPRADIDDPIGPMAPCNASGKPLNEAMFHKKFYRLMDPNISWEMAQVNHYAIKTRDVFDLKVAREKDRLKKVRHNDEMYEKYNTNEVEDTSILLDAERREAKLAELHQDPVLGDLHKKACAILTRRIADNASQA